MGWTKLVSMELDDESQLDAPMPIPMADKPRYPYGLRICLCSEQLKKLELHPDCEVGDVIDLRAFARVTSVTQNETEGGADCRVELTIEELAVENETYELNDDD